MTYTPIPRGSTDWDVPVNAAFADQDARITQNANDIASTDSSVSTVADRVTAVEASIASLDWQAQDSGFKAWAYDTTIANNTGLAVSGTIYFIKMPLRVATTITSLATIIPVIGATLTAGQNGMAVYSDTGTLLGQTADTSTSWSTVPAGARIHPLLTPLNLSPGYYYVALMSNGTTPATFARGAAQTASGQSINGSLRFLNTAGNTSFPASFTPGSATLELQTRWAGMI